MKKILRTAIVCCLGAVWVSCGAVERYDVVILNGRVMDPESGLDAVRNLGVRGDKIAALSQEPLEGLVVLDAEGQVVAPGFIDLHRHGHSPENYRAQIHDGVTTALELEIGVEDVNAFYAEREAKAAVNYGAAISHPYSRNLVMLGRNPGLEGEALTRALGEEQLEELKMRVAAGLDQGAVAVGFGIAYSPGATLDELVEIFRVAAKYSAVCHVHMRTDHETLGNLEEVLTAAERSAAALHVVHINSSARDRAFEYLERMRKARLKGIDVSTECYPYNRGSTNIQSHIFDGWEDSYTDEELAQFIWVETGETLNRKIFAERRKQGGTIILPPLYSEETVRALVADEMTMIASDGMWLDKGRAHPRTFGCFSRVLGRYVREQQALSLMAALKKMTVLPARRLEKRVPAMRDKGRLRVGADADIVVFDPETVIDKATWEDPAQYSEGFRHVLVNGVVTLENGRLIEGAAAGRAVRAEQAPM